MNAEVGRCTPLGCCLALVSTLRQASRLLWFYRLIIDFQDLPYRKAAIALVKIP